ncbi:MAG: hypothetical protein AAFP76_15185 [Bacteroidota bacterium]
MSTLKYGIVAFFFFTQSALAQVGIGTVSVNDSAILEILASDQGILISRLTNAQRAALVNPAKGMIIFNTDTDALNINTGTAGVPNWEAPNKETPKTSKIGQSAKYSNSDTSTNLNVDTAIELPIFGSEEWNDNTTLFSVSGTQIQIAEAGRYRIISNVAIASNSNSARKSPEIYLTINGTITGAVYTTGYMRRNSGHEESSLHLDEVINVGAGDIIAIEIVRAGNSGSTLFRSAGSSNFYVEKMD